MLPSRRLIILMLPAAGILLLAAAFRGLVLVAAVYLLVLAAFVAVDALMLPGRRQIHVRRISPPRLSLAMPALVKYEVWNASRRRVEVRLAEGLPAGVDVVGAPPAGVFDPAARGELSCRLVARVRGRLRVPRLDVRVLPQPGLLVRQFSIKDPVDLDVFPNLVNLRRYDLMLRRGLLHEQGAARLRRIGQGSEFESLRPIAPDDEMSRVDWKSTAKHGKLMVRNYQPERQQSVVVAMDVGHATASQYEGLSQLDHFVNAALMLSYVTMRQGDWFSLVAFSDRIESYLPPVRGAQSVERVAQALYRLQPRLVAADYAGACRFLGLRSRKRGLICLMTDVIDREASEIIIANMARFSRYHLPLAVTIRDPDLDELARRPLARSGDPHAKAVALDILAAREEALAAMRQLGVDVLDSPPPSLTPDLIDRYLRIKASHRL